MMDEVFGYVPPTANPPSKTPILTLLKQARAFGLGVVLATQNPVDLDYKSLSNAGLWFLGRLQTARDMARVLEGLEGASASAGRTFDRGRLERLLAGLGSRTFLMHSIYSDAETVFRTRWTLSYLRGPLAREEIGRLVQNGPTRVVEGDGAGPAAGASAGEASRVEAAPSRSASEQAAGAAVVGGPRPILPPAVSEVFLAPAWLSVGVEERQPQHVLYQAALYGHGRVHFVLAKHGLEHSRDVVALALPPASTAAAWDEAVLVSPPPPVEPEPIPGVFASLPDSLSGAKQQAALKKSLAEHLYRTARLTLWKTKGAELISAVGETEAEFRLRLGQDLREARDAALEKVRQAFALKIERLEKRLLTARQRLEREQAEARDHSWQTSISIGSGILQAVLGRSRSLGRVSTSMKSASRAAKQRADVAQADESLQALQAERDALEQEMAAELSRLRQAYDPSLVELEPLEVAPRKSDVVVAEVAIGWVPDDPAAVIERFRSDT